MGRVRVVLGLMVTLLVSPLASAQDGESSSEGEARVITDGEHGQDPQVGSENDGESEPPPAPEGYVSIEPGSFMMGSPSNEVGQFNDEGPQHHVEITRGFYLKATEVTQGEWRALMGNNPSQFSSCGENCPVEQVSWYDAVAYCNALSRSEGLETCYDLSGCSGTPGSGDYTCPDDLAFSLSCEGYRLPTEAEWEYAYRAGTTTAFYNGGISSPEGQDSRLDQIGWYDQNSSNSTHPAGQKQANGWSLYDMAGNVWEWTWDWHGDYSSAPQSDPQGPASGGSGRVVRSGSWSYSARSARAANRKRNTPSRRNYGLGFRPSRSRN